MRGGRSSAEGRGGRGGRGEELGTRRDRAKEGSRRLKKALSRRLKNAQEGSTLAQPASARLN